MKKSKVQANLWGKSPKGWAEIQESQHKPLWEAMLNTTSVGKGTTLLDAGCGAGWSSALANERGAAVQGIDIAAELLSFAKKRVPNVKFQVADIQVLPFEDDMFDVVFAANSLQYSEDRIATLQEFKRVCKPNGQIIVGLFGAPEKVDMSVIFKAISDAIPENSKDKGGGPFELSLPGKLEDLFKVAGLSNIKSFEVNCPFEYSNFESFWNGNASGGPLQGILNIISEEKLKSVLREAVTDFILYDGRILIQKNIFKYVLAEIN